MIIFHKSSKHSLDFSNDKFDLELVSMSFSSDYPPPNYSQTIHHIHPCYELHFALCGHCIFELASGERFTVGEDDFIIFPPYVKHRIVSESRDFLKFASMFSFEPKNSNFYKSVSNTMKSTLLGRQNSFMKSCAEELISLAKFDIADISDRLSYTYLSFILNLFHSVCNEKEENSEEHNDRRIDEATDFIEKNISAKLTVDDVAKHLYISSKQLTRLFESILGITPGEYIINMRAKKITNLLLDIDYSLEDISEIMQYNDVSSMIKFFKRSEGTTPQKYRQEIYKF